MTSLIWRERDLLTRAYFAPAKRDVPASAPRGRERALKLQGASATIRLRRAPGSPMYSSLLIGSVTLGPAQTENGLYWVGISCVVALFYVGTYYGAPVQRLPPRAHEPTRSPRPIKVGRNLIAALVLFLLLDGAVFHTGLYSSVLSPQSYAGRMQLLLDRERQRPASSSRRVLVLGDSRMAEGFSDRRADELAGPGWDFINASLGGTTPRVWYYMLREMDARGDRYAVVVLPVEHRDVAAPLPGFAQIKDALDKPLDITLAAPLLRYADCLAFPSSFPGWNNQCRAFMASVLRGSSYHSDLLDFVEHPARRYKQVRASGLVSFRKGNYPGKEQDLVGVKYDQEHETLVFPAGFPPASKAMLERRLAPPQPTPEWPVYRKRWIGKILRHYANSQTRIVLLQLPRGPFVREARSPEEDASTLSELVENDRTILLGQDEFRDLENPKFFFDALHPNAGGYCWCEMSC